MREGSGKNNPNYFKRVVGCIGESCAESFLKQKGFVLVARNFSTRWGELDLIMMDGHELVFVEVRRRRSQRYGPPEESITSLKIKHLVRAATTFLNFTGSRDQPIRFDVVCLVPGEIRHIKSAFEAGDQFYI